MAVAITEESGRQMPRIFANWHRTAPRRVVKPYGRGELSNGWTAWLEYLVRRKQPGEPPFLAGREPPLLWSLPPEWIGTFGNCKLHDVARTLASEKDNPHSVVASQLHNLADLSAPHSFAQVFDELILAYSLPRLSRELSADRWWQLLERLYDLASEAQLSRVDWPADPYDVLRQQLLAGELPFALSYLFPEIRSLRALRKPARETYSEALIQLTDGEGLPHARLLPVFGPLIACWTRARWLGDRLSRRCWSPAAEYQYRWLVRQAIRLTDGDHRFVLTPDGAQSAASNAPLLEMAIDLAGRRRERAAFHAAQLACSATRKVFSATKSLPKPSLDSDWSGISVMASGWSRGSTRLALDYSDNPLRLELLANGQRLFIGTWPFETTCDGVPAVAAGKWENLCWQSDKTCDLLELRLELSGGLRLERQLLFGRTDNVLYLADMVFAVDGQPRRLKHSFSLPVDDTARWQPESETRDGLVYNRKECTAVLPVGLPEWRADSRGGSLVKKDDRLVLTHELTGRALCSPLFLDFNPKRANTQRTWRQLTVAEWMQVMPQDVAVSYRAQCGRDQWLIYRSLGPAGNRTVLGQNIAGEFCAGRFHATGQFDDWIEIEAV
jgi:hypothetical protein